MLRRINNALPGLVAGILLYILVIWLAVMMLAERKLYYSVGLWYGGAIAAGMAIHLATVIYDSVSMGQSKQAHRRIIAKSILRYVIVVVLFFILGYFNFGSLLTAFLGVLGLKISAYMQPCLKRITDLLFRRSDASSDDEITRNIASSEEAEEPRKNNE